MATAGFTIIVVERARCQCTESYENMHSGRCPNTVNVNRITSTVDPKTGERFVFCVACQFHC